MIAGSSRLSQGSSAISSGIIAVAIAPPGGRTWAATGVSARSAGISRATAYTAAPEGPEGMKLRRVIVCSLREPAKRAR